ncbi:hypothetical protein D9758_014187 [Tetrapyrgos nigripes]|uniref:Uncharacterized protein n=1 Tax=Tetrapyrgos nigripes TaxID=182062 RepID=A0A8H5CL84_9AGAR|nr:hypothetical protein D9758_014187 [Tetrapyrgos nigripes]
MLAPSTIPAPTPVYASHAPNDFNDEDELKQFFFSLHSFKPSSSDSKQSRISEVYTPISRAGSGFSDSESDDEEDIFALDREDYDFEAHLPRSMVNTIRDLLDDPEPLPKNTQLNPNATPFVPRPARSHSYPSSTPSAPSRRESEPSLPYLTIPSFILQAPPSSEWTAIFARACLLPPTALDALSNYARDLVHSRLWNREALAELAQHFCWKAFCPQIDAESRSSSSPASLKGVLKETLAPFAAEVHYQLYLGNDEETANSFIWHLRESVLGTFRATWHASKSAKAISYRVTPTFSYVESGLSLVCFIGDLFSVRLFDEPQVGSCLSILVDELVSLEHISAIFCLIKHAEALFWCYQPYEPEDIIPSHLHHLSTGIHQHGLMRKPKVPKMKAFLDHFLVDAAAVKDGHSVLSRKVVIGEREQIVREIVSLLVGWGRCDGFWDDGGRLDSMRGVLPSFGQQWSMGDVTHAIPALASAEGENTGICSTGSADSKFSGHDILQDGLLHDLPPPPGLGFVTSRGQ